MRKQSFFEFISNSSISTSFLFIWGETINTFIHSRSSLENHTRFQTKKDQKSCPLGRTYLYIGSISPGHPSINPNINSAKFYPWMSRPKIQALTLLHTISNRIGASHFVHLPLKNVIRLHTYFLHTTYLIFMLGYMK